MAWFKNGRKYWYHNGRRYSRRISNESFESYDIAFGNNFGKKGSRQRKYWVTKIMNEDLKNQELEKAAKHTEAMEYRRKLLKENRNSWYSSSIQGSSIAISGTDDEILEIKRRNEAREKKENLNNTNDNVVENIWAK